MSEISGQKPPETVRQLDLPDTCKSKQAVVKQADTREKLEAELRDELRLVFGGNGGQRYASYKFVQSLLDRQAAITEREVKERVDFSLIAQTADALFPDYQERIAELTAERDELQAAIDACGTGTMYELWRKDHARLEAIRAALHDNPGT